MEEQLPQPDIATPQPTPVEENVSEQRLTNPLPGWLPTAGVILLILISIFAITNVRRSAAPATPGPAPSAVPSVRSNQPLSPLATQSAFLSLQASLATLSAHVTTLSTQDSTLTPPTLDLPLGFTQ